MDTPQTARRTRRKDARPGELLQAALDLFIEKGYAATRVEDIARHAQVSKGTLFLYFPSKEELFKAVVRENIGSWLGEWGQELAQYKGPTTELVRLISRRWWERVGETQAGDIAKLVMCEASHFPEIAAFYEHEVIRPGRALVRRILQRGIDRGEFIPVDLDYAIYDFIAPMMFMTTWARAFGRCVPDDQPIDPKLFLEHHTELVLKGLLVNTANGDTHP